MNEMVTIPFGDFAKYPNLRMGTYYHLPELKYSYRPFKEVVDTIESGSRPNGGINPSDQGQAISLGGEQIGADGTLCLDRIPYIPFDYYYSANRGRVKNNDILICKDGALTGKVCIVDVSLFPHDCIMVNEHVYIVRGNNEVDQKFLYCLMRMELFRNQIIDLAYRKKGQPGLNSDHINSLMIPDIPLKIQRQIIEKINPIFIRIEEIQKGIKTESEIINNCFQKEFSFDYDEFIRLKEHHNASLSFSNFSNNPDLRFSAKFHRKAGLFVMQQLTDRTLKRIKHYLSEPIVLGASISPNDYSDDEGYYYISMATIKNWRFEAENANFVSDQYATDNSEKAVQKNDIIIARSGEGTIGKVALISDESIHGIFADFTMRIRLKDYNPEFAYYYFRTAYFQYLIEVYKKGLGNNTNIFPINIQEFPLLDISQDEQQRIVDEIHSEILKQDAIKNRIANLRLEIDEIIKRAIIGGDRDQNTRDSSPK